MKNAYNTHSDLAAIISELRNSEKVVETLRNKLDFLEGQLNREKAICDKLQKFNDSKRGELNQLNKHNLKVSYDIEEIMDRINEIKNPPSFFLTNDRSSI
mmetsp:Transcript_14278/g.10327  ORF Transcript_14278/g.10327 Transcript_14278/m.10327 type:complete len:100 (+) Transcript_14278:89-388(+)